MALFAGFYVLFVRTAAARFFFSSWNSANPSCAYDLFSRFNVLFVGAALITCHEILLFISIRLINGVFFQWFLRAC